MTELLWVACGGALGTAARYGLGRFIGARLGNGFPLGTFAVNLLGCFLFGVAWALGNRYAHLERLSGVVLVGFMGGLTTFSSFVHDSSALFSGSRWLAGLGNILLQVTLGLAGLYLGMRVAHGLSG